MGCLSPQCQTNYLCLQRMCTIVEVAQEEPADMKRITGHPTQVCQSSQRMCNIAEAAQEESAALRETADMLRQHAAKSAKQAATTKAELAALRSQASCNSKTTKHIVIQHVLSTRV